jgi:hypothetical protein
VVWQALGADPRTVSARSAAQRLDHGGYPCHLVWNPLNGEIVQLIPSVRAGRSLCAPEFAGPLSRPVRDLMAAANNEGRVCVQIGVVALATEPFTAGPMTGIFQIMRWLDSWGVPRVWPAGQPASVRDSQGSPRSRRLWARGGHFGASQVPGLSAVGPGQIDTERLTGWSLARNPAAELESGGCVPPLGMFLNDDVTGDEVKSGTVVSHALTQAR